MLAESKLSQDVVKGGPARSHDSDQRVKLLENLGVPLFYKVFVNIVDLVVFFSVKFSVKSAKTY